MRHLEDPKLLENVLKRRAARLGTDIEALTDSKRELETLRPFVERAAVRGIPVLQALQEVLSNTSSEYPGPDCLLPHEVEALANQTLSEARQKHLASCAPCRSLANRLRPNVERLVAFEAKFEETRRANSSEEDSALMTEGGPAKVVGAY